MDGLTYDRRRSLVDIMRAESSGSIRPPKERIVVLRDLSVRSLIADPQGLQLLSKPRHLRPDPLHPLWVLRPVVPLLLQHDGVPSAAAEVDGDTEFRRLSTVRSELLQEQRTLQSTLERARSFEGSSKGYEAIGQRLAGRQLTRIQCRVRRGRRARKSRR